MNVNRWARWTWRVWWVAIFAVGLGFLARGLWDLRPVSWSPPAPEPPAYTTTETDPVFGPLTNSVESVNEWLGVRGETSRWMEATDTGSDPDLQTGYRRYIASSCAWCGTTEHLESHHVIPQSMCRTNGHPEWADEEWNQITLCRADHWRLAHRGNFHLAVTNIRALVEMGRSATISLVEK